MKKKQVKALPNNEPSTAKREPVHSLKRDFMRHPEYDYESETVTYYRPKKK